MAMRGGGQVVARGGILLLGAALCTACGGDDDAAVDGGSPRDDAGRAADSGAPDAAGPRRVADNVVFLQRDTTTQIRFSDDPDGPSSCLNEPVAGCEIQTCRPAAAIVERPDAGLVSVNASDGHSYLPDESGTYPLVPPVSWEDGTEVVVMAAGAEAPAFEVALTGPGDIETVVAPVFPMTVTKQEPVAVEWTGTDAFASFAIRCPEPGPEGESVQVRCPFADGTSGEVPVAALERLPACAATANVFTEHREVIDAAPGWVVRVATRGVIHSGAATVQ